MLSSFDWLLISGAFSSCSSSALEFRSVWPVPSLTSGSVGTSLAVLSDFVLSGLVVLPGVGLDVVGDTQELAEVVLALVVEEVVEVLPVENEFDIVSALERSEEHPEVEIGDTGVLVLLQGEVLLDDDDTLIEQVSVDLSLNQFVDENHMTTK